MATYSESTIPMQIVKVFDNRDYRWNDNASEATIRSIFEGCAVFLGMYKSKDHPTAVLLNDAQDRFHFGAFTEFHKGEDENDEGYWSLNYTFDENDIDYKSWKVYKFVEDKIVDAVFEDIAYSEHGLYFKFRAKDDLGNICEGSAQELMVTILDVIKDYMRANVTVDPILEFPNLFTATAELNADQVYIGIEPSPLLRQYVKDDAKNKQQVNTDNIPQQPQQ